jgi:dTDP-4-dehydrorhamnose 3,5-epimerase
MRKRVYMIVKPSSLEGVYEIESKRFEDHRGVFVKTFHDDVFLRNGLDSNFKESFYSVSRKNVLRGMHFQCPPHDHAKLVYVTDGEILDVAVDIRRNSETFGLCVSKILSANNAKSLYIGKGFAHGFLTLSNVATVVYHTTTVHAPNSDSGVRWDSFGFLWPIDSPVLSERDRRLSNLELLYKI